MRFSVVAALVAAAVVSANGARAGDECQLGDRTYPPDVTVCSNGLALTCQNGTWQNNDGQRCEEETGEYVGARRPFEHKNDEAIPDYVKEEYPWLPLE